MEDVEVGTHTTNGHAPIHRSLSLGTACRKDPTARKGDDGMYIWYMPCTCTAHILDRIGMHFEHAAGTQSTPPPPMQSTVRLLRGLGAPAPTNQHLPTSSTDRVRHTPRASLTPLTPQDPGRVRHPSVHLLHGALQCQCASKTKQRFFCSHARACMQEFISSQIARR